jgi:hypothetical protein
VTFLSVWQDGTRNLEFVIESLHGCMCLERVLADTIDMRKGTVSCSLYIWCGDPDEEQLSKAAIAIAPEACSKGRILEVVEQSPKGFTEISEQTGEECLSRT